MEKVVFAAISGEIVLKSERTRPRFERRLISNVRDALERNNVKYHGVRLEDARLIIETPMLEETLDVLKRVFGVHGATIAYRVNYRSLEDLSKLVEMIAAKWVQDKKFAVRAKRAYVEDFTSLDIARVVGARLKPYSKGVDLENPDVEVHVEVRGYTAYIHQGLERGSMGLPIGVEGRAIVLFSGGIDSPVAAWLTAKRGVEVDLLHYILANPVSREEAHEVAKTLASQWLYGYKPRMLVVDLRLATAAIAKMVRRDYSQLVLRLVMYNVAARIAEEHGYDAIVTGESLGQVSTQTLANIKALSLTARIPYPILRPLIGMDKEEIVQLARRIGTYDSSTRVREYCRLAQGPVATRADTQVLASEYEKIANVVDEIQVTEVIELA